MNPTNSSKSKDTCISTSSNCIIWEGSDITCIDLCNGDTISDVTYKLGIKLCDFIDDFDFSSFDLSCIAPEGPEPEKTLLKILELLRDKTCELESIIDGLDLSPTVDFPVLDVNLKCLAITDGSGNVLNDDSNEEIVQAIIDEVCELRDDVDTLETEVDDHEERITALEEAELEIPEVSSDCVFVGTKSIDEAYEALDADYCNLKSSIGEPEDISAAIGQQCDLPALVGDPSFIVSPTNLAESFNNLWLAYCNLLSRVTLIEETCCAVGCDDVKVGFSTTFNSDSTVTLNFNAGTGTTIPAGFEDCGSILTITDTAGNSIAVALTITNNYTSPDIDLTSFTPGSTLTFSLDLKMCADGITCQKCITKTVQYAGSECCEICNNGSDDILIVYKVLLNPNS
jgi:hypothetical protein